MKLAPGWLRRQTSSETLDRCPNCGVSNVSSTQEIDNQVSVGKALMTLIGSGRKVRILESSNTSSFNNAHGLTIQFFSPDWKFGDIDPLSKAILTALDQIPTNDSKGGQS